MSRGGKNFIDLSGQEFGKLLVIERAENNKHGRTRWVCICICGKDHIANGSDLVNGHTTQCTNHVSIYCKWDHLRTPENIYPSGWCKTCAKEHKHTPEVHAQILKKGREHYAKNGDRCRRVQRGLAASLKLEALTHYGPEGVLGCCWEGCPVVDIDMLSLDHINNNGAEHRRQVGKNKTGEKMYRLVKQEEFPEGFQTLCMNHQTKKKLLNVRSKQK